MSEAVPASRTPLLIIGAGQHAAVVRDCVDETRFAVIGYIDDGKQIGTRFGQDAVLGGLDDLPILLAAHIGLELIIAIGNNSGRQSVAERTQKIAPGVKWATIIHPSAVVSRHARIGAGSVIVARAVINCHTQLGRHVLINTGSLIDHDNVLGDFASTGPGVVTGGHVHVGHLSHVGIGASVLHGTRIGSNCVIGGQAFVDRDLGDNLVSFGVPARTRRTRALGEAYL